MDKMQCINSAYDKQFRALKGVIQNSFKHRWIACALFLLITEHCIWISILPRLKIQGADFDQN